MTDTPKKPYDKKIHMLIMDDSIGKFMKMQGIKPERLLDGTGLNVEIKLAETPEAAEYELEEWAKKGIKPDIVTTDVIFGAHHVGIQELGFIMDRLYKDMPDLKPAKIFVHSKSGIEEGDSQYAIARGAMKRLGAEYCHTDELMVLGDTFGSDREQYMYDRRSPTTNSLRHYLKEQFGIEVQDLTRDEIEANKRRTAAERVGDNIHPYDAVNAVSEGGITPQIGLRKISPDLLAQSLEPTLNNQKPDDGGTIDYHPITFKNAVGGAATGVAAFTAEEVKQYKAEGKKVILVLQNFTPADTKLLGKVDGVALLGRGSNHLPVLCKNHGIPGIFAQDGPKWGKKGTKPLSIQKDDQGYKLVSINTDPDEKDDERKKLYEFTVRSGQPISIETSRYTEGMSNEEKVQGQLYRQGIAVETPFAPWYVEPIIRWARAERGQEWHRKGNHYCRGLMVKANADTAEQAKKAFEFGAQGIGLLRTEHMLMQEDRLHHL